MENIQRIVMLLKPDGHVGSQWDSSATLKISAFYGGIDIAYQSRSAFGAECMLTLFTKDGLEIEAGKITDTAIQTKIGNVRLDDVAGAAVIKQGDFILKSSGLSWPDIIARYRFKHAQRSEAPTEMQAQVETDVREAAEPQETAPSPPESEAPPEPQSDALQSSVETVDSPAQAFVREPDETCPHGIRQSCIDPFPGVFPGSEWARVSYPGPAGWWHYIFGRVKVDGSDADAIGVPGDYSMAPPVWLDGFSTYVRCTSGDARGYWLMFQDSQTGRVLDINRSRHGG
jgi:hypothetical protein